MLYGRLATLSWFEGVRVLVADAYGVQIPYRTHKCQHEDMAH